MTASKSNSHQSQYLDLSTSRFKKERRRSDRRSVTVLGHSVGRSGLAINQNTSQDQEDQLHMKTSKKIQVSIRDPSCIEPWWTDRNIQLRTWNQKRSRHKKSRWSRSEISFTLGLSISVSQSRAKHSCSELKSNSCQIRSKNQGSQDSQRTESQGSLRTCNNHANDPNQHSSQA